MRGQRFALCAVLVSEFDGICRCGKPTNAIRNIMGDFAMSILRRSVRALLPAALAAVPLLAGFVSAPANAGERSHTAVRTGANGKTATRTGNSNYDASTGTFTRDVATTGPNGNTSSAHIEVVRTEDGFERSATRTGPDGKTATSSTAVARTEDGYTRDSAKTGPNGKTVTTAVAGSYDAETNTATRTRTTTGPDGQTSTATQTRTVTRTP